MPDLFISSAILRPISCFCHIRYAFYSFLRITPVKAGYFLLDDRNSGILLYLHAHAPGPLGTEFLFCYALF